MRRQEDRPRGGPFTVESVSPYRVPRVDENDELIGGAAESTTGCCEEPDNSTLR